MKMATVSQVLLDHLDDLVTESFKRFKWGLTGGVAKGFAPISRSSLEHADRQQVVDLMIGQYGKQKAGEIAVKILREINQNNLAGELEDKLAKVPVQDDTAEDSASSTAQVPAVHPGAPVVPGATGVSTTSAAPGVQQSIKADGSSSVKAHVVTHAVFNAHVNFN